MNVKKDKQKTPYIKARWDRFVIIHVGDWPAHRLLVTGGCSEHKGSVFRNTVSFYTFIPRADKYSAVEKYLPPSQFLSFLHLQLRVSDHQTIFNISQSYMIKYKMPC